MLDFSNSKDSYKDYGGSNTNKGIIYNNQEYLMKIHDEPNDRERKDSRFVNSYRNNIFSEYIACKIIKEVINYPVQDVLLGIYKFPDKIRDVVLCKDLLGPTEQLTEFNNISTIDIMRQSKFQNRKNRNLDLIFEKISYIKDKELKNGLITHFWYQFIIDTLIGNFDRHGDNWGIIRDRATDKFRISPIYDCGSSLSASIAKEEIVKLLLQNDSDVYYNFLKDKNFMAFQYENGEERITYYDFYKDLYKNYKSDFLKGLDYIFPKIDIAKINEVIDNIADDSVKIDQYELKIRKEFNKKQIKINYDYLILPIYNKLHNPMKIMSLWEYNIITKSVKEIHKESVSDMVWERYKTFLDGDKNKKKDNITFYFEPLIKDKNVYRFAAYNIGNKDNIKPIMEEYLTKER